MEIFTPIEHRRQRIAAMVHIALVAWHTFNHRLYRSIPIEPFRTWHTIHIRITHDRHHPRPLPTFLRHTHHSFSPSNRPTFGPCVIAPSRKSKTDTAATSYRRGSIL